MLKVLKNVFDTLIHPYIAAKIAAKYFTKKGSVNCRVLFVPYYIYNELKTMFERYITHPMVSANKTTIFCSYDNNSLYRFAYKMKDKSIKKLHIKISTLAI